MTPQSSNKNPPQKLTPVVGWIEDRLLKALFQRMLCCCYVDQKCHQEPTAVVYSKNSKPAASRYPHIMSFDEDLNSLLYDPDEDANGIMLQRTFSNGDTDQTIDWHHWPRPTRTDASYSVDWS
jgi:hypothetical protein